MMFGDFVAKVLDGAECAVLLLPILVISLNKTKSTLLSAFFYKLEIFFEKSRQL